MTTISEVPAKREYSDTLTRIQDAIADGDWPAHRRPQHTLRRFSGAQWPAGYARPKPMQEWMGRHRLEDVNPQFITGPTR